MSACAAPPATNDVVANPGPAVGAVDTAGSDAGPPAELAQEQKESDIERAARAVAEREVVVVETTAQAKKYASEDEVRRAYRECMRKMRRITGSRIPRNACQGSAGLYSGAYNQAQEGAGDRGPSFPAGPSQ